MTETVDSTSSLWSDQWEAAFSQGAAVELVRRRNPALGSLLTSDRAGFYIQILYRLFSTVIPCFREAAPITPVPKPEKPCKVDP